MHSNVHELTAPHVSVKRKCTLLPASPSAAGQLFLSAVDILNQDIHYNRRIMFFNSPTLPDQNATDILRRSLCEILVHYFPWSGRIAVGSEDGRLVIDCNDAGVEFVEAAIDFPMSKLAAQGFQMTPLYEELCPKVDHRGDCLYTSPLLAVQVTRFSDEGLALGLAHSHVVADGQSLWNFLVGWGECGRNVELSVQPLHERRRMALTEPPSEDKAKGFSLDMEIKPEDYDGIDNGSCSDGTQNDSAEVQLEQSGLAQCVLELTKENIEKLKAEAGGGFSSYEVMCAHFWQRTTAARQLSPKSAVMLSILADCRSRRTPPLPPSYFGNAINSCFAWSTAGKICSEPLRNTAARVREATHKAAHGSEAQVNWLELRGNRLVPYFGAVGMAKCMHVASSPRFPAYKVDFGWGTPCGVRLPKVPGDGEMVMFGGHPGSSAGDVEVCYALEGEVMGRLLRDPAFLATTRSPVIFPLDPTSI